MSGALIDLVAIGVQDTYLTGDPQTTYFRQNYKRHTNFAMEPVRQVVEGDRSLGGWSSVTITRNGDLLTDVYFLNTSTGADQTVSPFDEVQLYIGGQKVDTLTDIENISCAQMFRPCFSTNALTAATFAGTKGSHSLQFFFGRGYQCALPLCALQYHDVTLRIKWKAAGLADINKYQVYADYVQLDTAERNAFASKPLTMLIEQHQRVPLTIPTVVGAYTNLEFSHPVKAIYGQTTDLADGADSVLPTTAFMKLEFNGRERLPILPAFNYFQDHQMGKHTEHSATSLGPMYSFALYANRLTPTGSCNFSRIDNARLTVSGTAGSVQGKFFALNWNFLKLEDGMGGLLFAN